MKKVLFLGFILLINFSLFAQKKRDITGEVSYKKKPISGIKVIYKSDLKENSFIEARSTTDLGEFKIGQMKVGDVLKITLKSDKYRTIKLTHTVTAEYNGNHLGMIDLKKKTPFCKTLIYTGSSLIVLSGISEFAISNPAYRKYSNETRFESDYNRANTFRRIAIVSFYTGLVVSGIGIYKCFKNKKRNKNGLTLKPIVNESYTGQTSNLEFGLQLTF